MDVSVCVCVCVCKWTRAVRSSWVTVTFYGAIFGLLGGQFGLYFYDLFEARLFCFCLPFFPLCFLADFFFV